MYAGLIVNFRRFLGVKAQGILPLSAEILEFVMLPNAKSIMMCRNIFRTVAA